MAEPIKNLADSNDQAQVPFWQRQEGEPLLWYNRFKLFRNLGYKRTLLAALLKERDTVKVLKGPKIGKKPGVQNVSKRLSEVPKPALVQVPGSWKRASIAWHWVERAAAYDEHLIDQMIDTAFDDLLDGAGTSFQRVMLLKQLLDILRNNLNTNAADISLEQLCMMLQRMQSIMKQISDEMLAHDEAMMRSIARHLSVNVYQAYDPAKSKEE